MDTTKLIVEYLIVGILVCIAVIFFGVSLLSPADAQPFSTLFSPEPLSANTVVSAVIFLPIAYGVGVLVEYVAMRLFENKADDIKLKRLNNYLNEHETILKNSKLLKQYLKAGNKEARISDERVASMLFGEMRFYAMVHSEFLRGEIEGHLNRLRILRSLPIVEILFISGLLIQVVRQGVSNTLIFAIIFIAIIMPVNLSAITNRQQRYNRAIERAYISLIVEEKKA